MFNNILWAVNYQINFTARNNKKEESSPQSTLVRKHIDTRLPLKMLLRIYAAVTVKGA